MAGKVVWYSHLLKNFPHFFFFLIYTVTCFRIVSEAEVFFLGFSYFFYYAKEVGNLISGSSVFFKIQFIHLEILSSHTVEALLEDFERYFASL